MTQFLARTDKPSLAYVLNKNAGESVDLPPIVFLGGFRSDMEGTKAIFLEEYCKNVGRDFLRFDYSGHGQSGGDFEDLVLSDWYQDGVDAIEHCFDRPVLLVGSSMGGWISLVMAQMKPELIAGIIGLAAAPDFTKWMEAGMSEEQTETLERDGQFNLPNDYGEPYVITKDLIEDGRALSLLHKKLECDFPIHLIQGKKDADVPWETAEKIKDVFGRPDVRITYIDEADHRLSAPDELEILRRTVESL